MGGWRGRGTLVCALLGTVALGAAGCGVEEHANEPRTASATRISVSVTEDTVTVQPTRIAVGPEPATQIPQNREVEQPQVRSRRPLDVVLVAANLTDFNSKLVVRGSRTEAISGPLVANGNASLQTALPSGVYRVSAAGLPGAEPAQLVVGTYRTSSENDVLLP
jgi:hypothetical protein